jgi:hypothetical protein
LRAKAIHALLFLQLPLFLHFCLIPGKIEGLWIFPHNPDRPTEVVSFLKNGTTTLWRLLWCAGVWFSFAKVGVLISSSVRAAY